MLQKYHIKVSLINFAIIIILTFSCAKEEKKADEILPEKPWMPRVDDRVKQAADEGKGLLGKKGIFGKDDNTGGTIKFANTNILWKASLKTLENIPLMNVDYAGGIIITDWYGNSNNSEKNEEIKITVKFLSDEVKATSFDIIAHKKTCLKNSCTIKITDSTFNEKIKEAIVTSARSIALDTEKKKKQ